MPDDNILNFLDPVTTDTNSDAVFGYRRKFGVSYEAEGLHTNNQRARLLPRHTP